MTAVAGQALVVAREVGMPVVCAATWKKTAAPWGNCAAARRDPLMGSAG